MGITISERFISQTKTIARIYMYICIYTHTYIYIYIKNISIIINVLFIILTHN